MGGKTVIVCLSALVFYFATANCYVIIAPDLDPESVVKTQNNQLSSNKTENWYNLTPANEADTICGTTETEYTFFENTQSCYKVHRDEATWNDAEAACVREGGHLAVINSQDEADFLVKHFPNEWSQGFLGFYWNKSSWMTNQGQALAEVGYENWHDGEPKFEFEIDCCGTMFFTGTFNYVPCGHKNIFICEKYSNKLVLSSPATEVSTNFVTTETGQFQYILFKDTSEVEETSISQVDSEPTSIQTQNTFAAMDTEYICYVHTKSCYKIHRDAAMWYDAEDTCVREGGHLAVINSQGEADFIIKHFPENLLSAYIGIHWKAGSWVTVQNQTLTEAGYENWYDDEQKVDFQIKHCGVMNYFGYFNYYPCVYGFAFICEKDAIYSPSVFPTIATFATEVSTIINTTYKDTSEKDETSNTESLTETPETTSIEAHNECGRTDSGYKFVESTKSCYKVHTDRATWHNAEVMCVREGGHLAVINSQDEADVLTKMYPEGAEHVFVGFSYREQDSPITSNIYGIRGNGVWLTIDGQTLSEAGYENWTPGEPNNAGGREYCGTIYLNGKFDDKACFKRFQYICETNPSLY